MKEKLELVKKFVVKHKEAIVVGAVGVTGIAITMTSIVQHVAFLKEKDLLEEYYPNK